MSISVAQSEDLELGGTFKASAARVRKARVDVELIAETCPIELDGLSRRYSRMVLAELRHIASELGIRGVTGMTNEGLRYAIARESERRAKDAQAGCLDAQRSTSIRWHYRQSSEGQLIASTRPGGRGLSFFFEPSEKIVKRRDRTGVVEAVDLVSVFSAADRPLEGSCGDRKNVLIAAFLELVCSAVRDVHLGNELSCPKCLVAAGCLDQLTLEGGVQPEPRMLPGIDNPGTLDSPVVLLGNRGTLNLYRGRDGFLVLSQPDKGASRWNWTRNKRFIDRALALGLQIRLLSDPSRSTFSSSNIYYRELKYLVERGCDWEAKAGYWRVVQTG